MSDQEILQALQDQEEAREQMHKLNALYQDIELVLAHDGLFLQQKLDKIAELNRQIGEITKEWI